MKRTGRLKKALLCASAALLLLALYLPFRFGAWTEVDNGWKGDPSKSASVSLRGVPDVYEAPCGKPGTVVSLSYVSCRYDDPSVEETREAFAYLPYGYDGSVPLDVLYLLHGSKDGASSWLKDSPVNKNVVDNLIDRGDVSPLIIVTPPLFAPDSFGFEDGFDGAQFSFELREKLIPAVEAAFSCASESDPENARSHRALAGVSRGAQAVFESGLGESLDLFSRFGAFSGMLTDPSSLLEKMDREPFRSLSVDLLYNVNGFFDYTFYEHGFRVSLLESMTDRIADGENACFLLIRNGEHSWPSWEAALYGFLQSAFPSGGGVRLPEISSSRLYSSGCFDA